MKKDKYELTPELKPAVRSASSGWFDAMRDSEIKKSDAVNKLANLLISEYGQSGKAYTDNSPLYLVNDYKVLITTEWVLGYKNAFDKALKAFKKQQAEGKVDGDDAPEPVTEGSIKRYARDFISLLKDNHCIHFNQYGRKENQSELDAKELIKIKKRATDALLDEAKSAMASIRDDALEIRDLANELVVRGGKKVRSPSATKALRALRSIRDSVHKKKLLLLK